MNISKTSGELSTSQLVRAGQGLLTYVEAGDQQVILYDSTDTSGPILASIAGFDHADMYHPVQFQNLYASVASTTSTEGALVHMI